MRWFRSSRRSWGWLALLALTLQLGMSFGHLHVAHALHPGLVTPAQDDVAAPLPPDHDDDHESHYCPIYAVNALLSGAQVAAAPVIPTPAAWAIAQVVSLAHGVAGAGVRRAAFHSRAPPLS
jgi:hypothetical protein